MAAFCTRSVTAQSRFSRHRSAATIRRGRAIRTGEHVTSRVITSDSDRDSLLALLSNHALPFTVNIAKGKRRSVEQNKLQRKWLSEAAEQLGEDTAEGYRAYCKLHFGVPILRNESDDFREAYDRIIRPHSYEDKLAMMALPLDFPVTRLMKTGQKKRYLDEIYTHFTSLGVQLTETED